MLATDGGLVFTGRMTGEFIAIDEATGKVLWQFQTGSGDQRAADHLHLQGQAVRDGALRCCGRCTREKSRAGGAFGRVGVDVRGDGVALVIPDASARMRSGIHCDFQQEWPDQPSCNRREIPARARRSPRYARIRACADDLSGAADPLDRAVHARRLGRRLRPPPRAEDERVHGPAGGRREPPGLGRRHRHRGRRESAGRRLHADDGPHREHRDQSRALYEAALRPAA